MEGKPAFSKGATVEFLLCLALANQGQKARWDGVSCSGLLASFLAQHCMRVVLWSAVIFFHMGKQKTVIQKAPALGAALHCTV